MLDVAGERNRQSWLEQLIREAISTDRAIYTFAVAIAGCSFHALSQVITDVIVRTDAAIEVARIKKNFGAVLPSVLVLSKADKISMSRKTPFAQCHIVALSRVSLLLC